MSEVESDPAKESDYGRLVRLRGYMRAALTKLLKRAEKSIDSKVIDANEAQNFIDLIVRKQKSVTECDDDILQCLAPDKVDDELESMNDYEYKSNEIIILLKSRIDSVGAHVSKPSVKLPKIELPSYSGDKLSWLSFWDVFESTIHTNNNLVDVNKFSYLISCLSGEALSCIAGLKLTSANYEVAVSILKEH